MLQETNIIILTNIAAKRVSKFASLLFFLFSIYVITSCKEPLVTNLKPANLKDSVKNHDEIEPDTSTMGMKDSLIKKDQFKQYLVSQGFVNIQEVDSNLLVDLKYSGTDNFIGLDLYGEFDQAFLQQPVAMMLSRAQQFLSDSMPGFRLIIYDALRPRRIQQMMWDSLQKPEDKKHLYVSDPTIGSIHNFGAAVDLSIADQHKVALDMGTPFDSFSELAYPVREEALLAEGILTREQVDNRKLLRSVMLKAGFTGITTEWWHFNAFSRKYATANFTLIEDYSLPCTKVDRADGIPVMGKLAYSIQIKINRKKLKTNDTLFKGLPVNNYFEKNYYKYYTGRFEKIDEAYAYRDRIKQDFGFNDAFVIVFSDGKRISIKDAAELSH